MSNCDTHTHTDTHIHTHRARSNSFPVGTMLAAMCARVCLTSGLALLCLCVRLYVCVYACVCVCVCTCAHSLIKHSVQSLSWVTAYQLVCVRAPVFVQMCHPQLQGLAGGTACLARAAHCESNGLAVWRPGYVVQKAACWVACVTHTHTHTQAHTDTHTHWCSDEAKLLERVLGMRACVRVRARVRTSSACACVSVSVCVCQCLPVTCVQCSGPAGTTTSDGTMAMSRE